MQFKLIEPKKSKGETEPKTEVKVSLVELTNPFVKLYLIGMGLDYSKPVKESSRYVYFIYNGDWMNKDRKKKF